MTDPSAAHPVPRRDYHPPHAGPTVVHEDLYEVEGRPGGFVAVDKPAGLLAVPGIGPDKADCARSRTLALYPWATGPMTVHRLDLATSGLLLIALDPWTQRNLSIQFERRNTTKRYLALVQGHLTRDEGVVDVPMRKDAHRPPLQLVDWTEGKPSRTAWRVLARESLELDGQPVPVTRIELAPETGRTHQLRVHASHPKVTVVREPPQAHAPMEDGLGAPIVGDELYAGLPAPRLMLHAWTLTLHHPRTGRRMSVRAEAPF